MAEEDIYKNKERFENFVANLAENLSKPTKKGRRKYYCKNPENAKHFEKLLPVFEMRDLSYVRRIKIFSNLKMITTFTDKDLSECDREDINKIVAESHKVNKAISSKKDFIKDIKVIWRILFPEIDPKGRIDDTLVPYAVRHLSNKIDKSKQKLRNDRITWDEFRKIVKFFSSDAKMQAYLMLAFESLGRPQEILYTKIKDCEFYDTYAKIWISEHGKEGTGFLQCIDSYPYLMEWYKQHPFKEDPNAFLFLNLSNNGKYGQWKNDNINKRIQLACRSLGIKKRITCYSLKRNGITYRRLRGDSDTQIQHAARWTSTKQLQVYDMSTQQDALNIELEKRGLNTTEIDVPEAKTKPCTFCGYDNGFTADFCVNCKRLLDREKIREMTETTERMIQNDMINRFDKMERMMNKMMATQ
jgi:integrase/recombinase XerD